MYRLIVAEDEEEFRKSIVKCIENSGKEYMVAGEAEDGQEAIQKVQECSPDILITDICMPRLDGLELIRRITEINPDMETVIISGYDDFHYVKEAMRMGVRDYLLKPFLPEELFHVLDKISSELERKKALVQNMKHMYQQIEEGKAYSRERFLRSLLQNKEEGIGTEEARQAGFDPDARWYACCTVRFFEKDRKNGTEGFMEMLKKYLQIVEENYFPEEIRCYNLNSEYEQAILVLCCHERFQRTAEQDIREGIERIAGSMEHYYKIRIRCTMGRMVQDYRDLAQSYRESLKAWKGVWEETEILVVYGGGIQEKQELDPEGKCRAENSVETARSNLLASIQMAQKEAAVSSLNDILQQYSRLPADDFQYVSVALVELVLDISHLTAKAVRDQRNRENHEVIDFLENYLKYGSLLEAKQVLERYIERSCEEFQRINEKQGDKIVRTAIEYIESNLSNEELSIEVVSDALHFSANYVRKLFRTCQGESFSDYLFRRRMEKAAELLRSPSCKIQEVAEQTGYSNQRYFARCFKKYYNCTPTEFRCK